MNNKPLSDLELNIISEMERLLNETSTLIVHHRALLESGDWKGRLDALWQAPEDVQNGILEAEDGIHLAAAMSKLIYELTKKENHGFSNDAKDKISELFFGLVTEYRSEFPLIPKSWIENNEFYSKKSGSVL